MALEKIHIGGDYLYRDSETGALLVRLESGDIIHIGAVEINDSNGNAYPFGSSGNYDWAGNRLGDYTTHWDGEDGLFNRWWKLYAAFTATARRVSGTLRLGPEHLWNLDLTKKKRIAGVDYFINKVDVTITMQGIKPANVELLKA